MKINVYTPSQMLSHFLLEDIEVAKAVSETYRFKEDDEIIATVSMNGVEVPAEVFERVLNNFWEQLERSFEEKYKDEAKAVHDAAVKMIEEQAAGVLDKLSDLEDVLRNADDIIKPYWDRS